MLATKILYNGDIFNLKADFKSVMERELNITYDKTDQKNIHIVKLSQPSTILYSFNDVDRLIELHDALEKKIISGGYTETYNLHCEYIKALAYMEQCGLPISSESWKNKMLEDQTNAFKWKTLIEEYIYDNIPEYRQSQLDLFSQDKKISVLLTSPLQMVKVFKKLGINTKDKEGKDSINESIISKSKHEFVDMWLKYQEANHRVTTFGDTIFKQIENERIYTNFNPMVDTARLSTRKGHINFLNFPSDKATRKSFKANEGNVMVVCDWSGQETVIAADLSQDEAMTKSVVEGADLHCLLARVLFPEIADLTDEEIIKQHKDKRQASKSPRFAMSYGGNAYTIHMNESIPLKRAQEIEDGFKKLHEGLYTWGEQVFQQSIATGYIESADGWKLKLPKYENFLELKDKVESIKKEEWQLYKQGKIDYKKQKEDKTHIIKDLNAFKFYKSKKKDVSDFFKLKSEYQRLCLNNPVQSRGAHQLKRATVMLFNWIKENNYLNVVKIVNTVHDECVLECPTDIAEIVKIQLEKCMVEGGNYYLSNLQIKADAQIGISWGDAK
jgi:DNA polymerase-1